MKSKKSIYILLPLVLLIWGVLIYQVFSFSIPTTPSIPEHNVVIAPLSNINKNDTFNIKIAGRDPFLGKIVTLKDSNLVKIKKRTKNIPAEDTILWPQIQYKGMVSDSKEKVNVYMVVIEGQTFLMKKGDFQNEVKLKDGDRETIYVNFKGELKVIFLQ